MASVKVTISYFLRMYPEHFDTAGDVLAHLFFSLDSKNHWVKGQLIPTAEADMIDLPLEELQECFDERIKREYGFTDSILAELKQADNSESTRLYYEIQASLPQWSDNNFDPTGSEQLCISRHQHLNPIVPISPIANLPQDICDDWLDAAEAVLSSYLNIRRKPQSNIDPEMVYIEKIHAHMQTLRH